MHGPTRGCASALFAASPHAVENIDCDFCRVDGLWVPAPETPNSLLDEELECCQRLGIPVEDRMAPTPFHSDGVVRSLRFPGQARFHPTKYLAGLASALQRAGAKLYADSCVESIEHKLDEVVVKVSSGLEVRAADVVVATNSPVNLEVVKSMPARPRGQVQRLQQVFKMMTQAPKGKTCPAILGLVEEGEEVIEDFEDSPALDASLLSGAQAVEHYEISRYGTLIAWAEQLGMTQAVQTDA